MKQTSLSTLSAAALLALSATMTQAASLTFTVEQVKNDQGMVYLQLFKGEDNYEAGKAYTASIIPAKAGSITVSFHDLAPGDYAVRYYHDENGDGELQTNLFGIPVEGFGFSNNARGSFGPATFEQMKVNIGNVDLNNASTIQY